MSGWPSKCEQYYSLNELFGSIKCLIVWVQDLPVRDTPLCTVTLSKPTQFYACVQAEVNTHEQQDRDVSKQIAELTSHMEQLNARMVNSSDSMQDVSMTHDMVAAEHKLKLLQQDITNHEKQTAALQTAKVELEANQAASRQLTGSLLQHQQQLQQVQEAVTAAARSDDDISSIRQRINDLQLQQLNLVDKLAQQRGCLQDTHQMQERLQQTIAELHNTQQGLDEQQYKHAPLARAAQQQHYQHALHASPGQQHQQQQQLEQQQHHPGSDLQTMTTNSVLAILESQSTAACAPVQQVMQQCQEARHDLLQAQMQFEVKQAAVSHSSHAQSLLRNTHVEAKTLHDAFSIKQPSCSDVRGMLKALAVICGSNLDVMLVKDATAANPLLDASAHTGSKGARLRIWPLGNLAVTDRSAQHRRAQQQLGVDAVWLPMDLIQYEAAVQPAMLRAFGGYVIAADDRTAAELVERYGVSSVTLAGSVSHRGSVSGGWMGGINHHEGRWVKKCDRDEAAEELREAEQNVQMCEAERRLLVEGRAALERAVAAQQELQQRKEAARLQLQQLQQILLSCRSKAAHEEQVLHQVEADLECCRSSTGHYQTLLQQQVQSDSDQGATAGLQQQLQAELITATAACNMVSTQLTNCESKVSCSTCVLSTVSVPHDTQVNTT